MQDEQYPGKQKWCNYNNGTRISCKRVKKNKSVNWSEYKKNPPCKFPFPGNDQNCDQYEYRDIMLQEPQYFQSKRLISPEHIKWKQSHKKNCKYCQYPWDPIQNSWYHLLPLLEIYNPHQILILRNTRFNLPGISQFKITSLFLNTYPDYYIN